MMKEQQEFLEDAKIQQKPQFSQQDKRILNQSTFKGLNVIQKQLDQHKKIFINVIGLNKNGKSVLCNELVNFQFEDQQNQTVEYIFPSHNDPMTTGKIHFETKFLIDQGQLFYLRKQFQRQIRVSFQRPSQQIFFFQTINQSPGELYKDQFKITDIKGNVLSSFRYQHALWRQKQKQLEELTMRKKPSSTIHSQIESIKNPKQQTLKTLAYFFQMMRWIQNDFSLSKYAVIVDHPGLNEYYQKTVTNKMNEITSSKEQKQKSVQQKKIEEQLEIIDDDYIPRIMNELKFKESQIIMYCSSHVSGLFNYDHEQNIRKLFQQNNPDQIVLAFCFIRSIQPGKFQKIKTQTSVYKNIFQIIPLKTFQILKKIICESQKNAQYKTFIGPSKIQKLIKIKQSLSKYIEYKNNYYQKFQLKNQTDSMSPLQKQQKKDRMFYSQEQAIRDLLKIYPFEWFHFYGLRQQQITKSIKSLQYIDQICKQNLKSTLKKKMGIIFERGFKQMQDFFKVVDRQIQIETKKINLSDNKKKAIENFYLNIRQSFMRFRDLYYQLQTEYSIIVQEQLGNIRKMYQKLIDKNYQIELKEKFRLQILLEKEIKTSIMNCFNEATLNISKALEKFKKYYNQFVCNEFQQFMKIFKKLIQSLMSKMHLKEKSQEKQITEQIVTNYKNFLTVQLFEDVSKKIIQWNQFLEYIQKKFQATTMDLNFYKIMIFKEEEDRFNIQKVQTESFWSKLLMPIYKTANIVKIIFQKQPKSDYYEQEWDQLNKAIVESIQATQLVKMNDFNFDKIVQKAQEEYIYKNKTVEKLSSIESLSEKTHNLKQKLNEKKQKIMLLLFPG